MDLNFKKIRYIRYADNFLVGITGSFHFAKSILEKLSKFLQEALFLNLSLNQTNITSFRKPILFLGFLISSSFIMEKPIKQINRGKFKGTKVRVIPRINMYVPIHFLIGKLVAKNFFKWENQTKKTARPTAKKNLVNLDHATIIQFYNCVIKGLMNYCKFVDNRKSIGAIVHNLKISCGLTLALKFKLRTVSKVFHKFGSKLRDPMSNIELVIPSTFSRFKKVINLTCNSD